MDIIELNQIISLISLALKQTDTKLIKKIINNIIKIIERNNLDKELKKEIAMLKTQENVIAGLNNLQRKIRELIAQENIQIQRYYPNMLVTQKSFDQIEVAIKEKRIRTKLKYILENKVILNKYTESLETSDMPCVKYRIEEGIIIIMIYYIEKGVMKICGFYTNHEFYMRAISSGIYYKRNFKNVRWLLLPEL